MDMSQKIEDVYQQALLVYQRVTTTPKQPALVQESLDKLYFALQELHILDENLQNQNQALKVSYARANRELQRYQNLLSCIPDGYLITNPSGIIELANTVVASLLKVPLESLTGKSLEEFLPEEDRSAFRSILSNIGRRSLRGESCQLVMKDWKIQVLPHQGDPIDVLATLTMSHPDDDGVNDSLEDSKLLYLWGIRKASNKSYRCPDPMSDQ